MPVFVKGYLKQYGTRLGLDVRDLLALYYKQTTLADVQIQPSRTIKLRDERQITSWILALHRAADGRRRSRRVVVERRQLRRHAVDARHDRRRRTDVGRRAAAEPARRAASRSHGAPAAAAGGTRRRCRRRVDAPAPQREPRWRGERVAGRRRRWPRIPPTTSATVARRAGRRRSRSSSRSSRRAGPRSRTRAASGCCSGLNAAGRRVTVRGEPPFAVVLGNADAVRLTVDGEPYCDSDDGPARRVSRASPSTSPRSSRAMAELIQPVKGMNDVLADQSAVVGPARVASRRAVRELRLSARAPARARAHGALQPLDRRAHRHRLEGDVHVRRPRREPHAAARRRPPASCARRLSNGLLHNQQQKLWCAGPMFRREKPQKGRYRQFHQMSVEALGFAEPEIDAELIAMSARLWRELGLTSTTLELNTIGTAESRRRTSRCSSSTSRGIASCSTKTACGASSAIRCGSSTARIPRCASSSTPRRCWRLSRRRVARALRSRASAARRRRRPVHAESAARARARLLLAHRVRVGHGPARRSERRLLGRPLRRARGAARRSRHAGRRLGARHRARRRAAAGGGHRRRRDARPMRTSSRPATPSAASASSSPSSFASACRG